MTHDASVDREAIVPELVRAGDFAMVEPSLVGYFEDDGMAYYLTLDVVETRMRRDGWRLRRRRPASTPIPTR